MLKELENLDDFKECSKSNYCMVGFYSPTCVECKKLAPLFKDNVSKYPNVNFLRVNFAELSNKPIIKEYRILSPTLVFFKKGKEYKRFAVEVVPLPIIRKEVLEFLESTK